MRIYSYSSVGAYENCPFQFKLRYIDRIKPGTEGVEAFMGSRVHESLEKLYRDKSMAKTPSLEELLDFYRQNWDKNIHDGVVVVRKDYSMDNYKEVGIRCLEEYYGRYFPFEQAKTIALEKRIEVPLGEADLKFVGFIDRLDRKEDGTYEIHDYKTSSTLPNQAEIDQDKQLALYQLGIEPLWDDTSNIELVWHYLKFDKELRSKRDRNTLDKLKNEFLSMIHEIEATEKFEPKESTLCNWCGYQDLCPSKKHAFKVVTEKPEAFLEDGGVKLVNRFIEVKSKKKELENEETRIKEAIFSYAASEGVDVLIGSGHKLKLKLSTRPKYPSKSDDEARYDALVDLLKKSDLWEEVSVFNQSKLLKYLKENKLKEDLLNSIKSYEEIVEDKRIYASRLKDIEDER